MIEEPLQQHIRTFLGSATPRRATNSDGEIALGTSVGLVRKENQDCALVVRADFGPNDERSFLVAAVCDGLGGMARGSEAAVLALSVFASRLVRTARTPLSERLEKAAEDANQAVHNLLDGRGGTTLSAVLIDFGRRIMAVSAGDSRVYGINYPDRVEQVSRDDNFAALASQPGGGRAALSNRLIQFVGMGEGVEFHITPLPPPSPKVAYLLTSDGAHSIDPEMFNLVVRSANPGLDVVRRLVTLAEWCGGKDNATAVYLPTSFSEKEQPKSNGVLTLTLHSVSRSRDVLIPTRNVLLEPDRPYTPPEPFSRSQKAEARFEAAENEQKTRRSPGRTTGKKKKGKSKRESRDATLPLDAETTPQLEVKYPEKPSN